MGEPPQRAVDRFIAEGWLIPASLSVKLGLTFNGTEIKRLLKEHGLSLSGRKEQCIERLVRDASQEMMAKVAHLLLVECSVDARAIAERFVAKCKAEREAAEAKSLEQLRIGDFRSACLTVAQFEAKQIFPRGVDTDWTRPNTDHDVEFLKAMFGSQPKILNGLSEADWGPLRVGAAMMALWGTNKASKWLPADFVGIQKFDRDVAARMLLFHAQNQRDMASYLGDRDLKTMKVEILGSGDSCPQCKKIAGKTYSIEKVPELPYEKCTHNMGCRCEVLPVL